MRPLLAVIWLFPVAHGQEAPSGFDLRATMSAQGTYSPLLSARPRDGSSANGGCRSILYPTWKLSPHWSIGGAWQLHSRPYFTEELSTQGRGVRGDLLQAHLTYARIWTRRSLAVRAGHLSSAFGSFLLRYDDARNPMIDMPAAYGYYYKGVTTRGLPGAQIDATVRNFDVRAQFTNSSPANRRSIFDRDQYGNWTLGTGFTILQGLRVGGSAYRGPYAHRGYAFYFPGEPPPRALAGSAEGFDWQFARGHWNASGEFQRFRMDYRVIPTFRQRAGYGEVRRVLHPRWYVAARAGYLRASAFPGRDVYEFVAGYRPNRMQILKAGYVVQRGPAIRGASANVFTVQLVTSLHLLSIAKD
ncbi:MAG: hypothetical protein HY820_44265 [Acidobacteria bacterium]|nr:hypothetical protein [Acidobacteriota bacterium]